MGKTVIFPNYERGMYCVSDIVTENVIEWLYGDKTVTLTLTTGRLKNKVLKLKEEYPEEVEIIRKNDDGSILAHLPLKWIKISPPRKMTEEQREQARIRGRELYKNFLSSSEKDVPE